MLPPRLSFLHNRRVTRRSYLSFTVGALVVVAGLAAYAQSRAPRGPRALAIVEKLPNGRARLTPVAILVDGKFYDANLYHATPRPMAVDSEVVYDVLHAGDPIGTFTVTAVADANGTWIAEGKIKAPTPEKAPSEITLGGKSSASKRSSDDEDKPPVLRRPEAKPNTPPGDTSSTSAPHADNPPPAAPPAAPSATKSPESSTTISADEAGRPTLKRGKPEPQAETETTPSHATSASATKSPSNTTEKPATPKPSQAPAAKEIYTAISDAKAVEYRPYNFTITPADHDRFTRDLNGMALEAITRFTSSHPTAGVPMAGPPQDLKLVAYDLDLNNMPTIVMTATKPATPRGAKGATQPVPALQLYVTVVAHTDIYGNIRRLFAHVTDLAHMDTIPRLELIDAVDAEGTGRGQLLFREINDAGSKSYVLYRVGADQLWPLFDGGESH